MRHEKIGSSACGKDSSFRALLISPAQLSLSGPKGAVTLCHTQTFNKSTRIRNLPAKSKPHGKQQGRVQTSCSVSTRLCLVIVGHDEVWEYKSATEGS